MTEAIETVTEAELEIHAKPQLEIRPATEADVMILKVILKRAHVDAGRAQFSRINDEKLVAYIRLGLAEGACFVAELDGVIVGTLCLRSLSEVWSDDLFLNEEWFYVLPKFRSTGAAKRLLDTAEQLADQMRLPVYMAINAEDHELVDEFIDRRPGYASTGRNFIRNPRDNGQQEDDDHNDP